MMVVVAWFGVYKFSSVAAASSSSHTNKYTHSRTHFSLGGLSLGWYVASSGGGLG